MKHQKRFLLLGLSTFLVAGFVAANIYIHNRNRKELREVAAEIALEWKEKLLLTPLQTMRLEDVIIDYTIIKNEIINGPGPVPSKIVKLKKVQKREHRSLRKIFNGEQFNSYAGLTNKKPNSLVESPLL